MKKQIITAAILFTIIPAVAVAGPLVGIGYADIGLSGHSGRPGVTVTAGNLYSNNVVASGSASFARGFYSMNVSVGKLIPAGGVSFVPYLGTDFLNLNYNQQETGYTSSTVNAGYGYTYTYQTPYSYTQGASIQDLYFLVGANMDIPLSHRVALQIGGGYGHTAMVMDGNGGATYKGKVKVGFEIAPRVTASLGVDYLHVPGASLTCYGAGLSYHF